MFASIKGRLGLIVSLILLLNACTFGDPFLSGSYQPPRDTNVAPSGGALECPGANADVSAALNGWSSGDASLPAYGALRLDLKARPTETLTGLFAVGAKAVNAFNEAAIAVRFGSDGMVDARDGSFYSSDVEYAYDPGVWYSIGIAADIDAKTYDVEESDLVESRARPSSRVLRSEAMQTLPGSLPAGRCGPPAPRHWRSRHRRGCPRALACRLPAIHSAMRAERQATVAGAR